MELRAELWGAPCRALTELRREPLTELCIEALVKLYIELLAKLRAELLAKLLVGPLVERRVELPQSSARSSARASAKYTPYIRLGSHLIFYPSFLTSSLPRRHQNGS